MVHIAIMDVHVLHSPGSMPVRGQHNQLMNNVQKKDPTTNRVVHANMVTLTVFKQFSRLAFCRRRSDLINPVAKREELDLFMNVTQNILSSK